MAQQIYPCDVKWLEARKICAVASADAGILLFWAGLRGLLANTSIQDLWRCRELIGMHRIYSGSLHVLSTCNSCS